MKKVTFKFKPITDEFVEQITDGVELDEDGYPVIDNLEQIEEEEDE